MRWLWSCANRPQRIAGCRHATCRLHTPKPGKFVDPSRRRLAPSRLSANAGKAPSCTKGGRGRSGRLGVVGRSCLIRPSAFERRRAGLERPPWARSGNSLVVAKIKILQRQNSPLLRRPRATRKSDNKTGGKSPPFLFRYTCDRSVGHDVVRAPLGREGQRLLYRRRRRMRDGLYLIVACRLSRWKPAK